MSRTTIMRQVVEVGKTIERRRAVGVPQLVEQLGSKHLRRVRQAILTGDGCWVFRGLEPSNFRGIRGGDIIRWLPRVGRPGSVPARLKSFRFKPEDLRLLEALAAEFGVSETEVVRRGLRALARDAEA